ncbi:MAG: 2-succinyl-5-enolpyruvyl-6-hydroxy-3-cyclohexene-1-carboxylic-acid synthase [Chloroflexi bacterium]|nr:2-succinyl-5-enolpyruvyl-6-hydroxy-3-cyclohexene-1-carboxylic-acid synthase [Chloroflexota bacterium]
MKAPENRNMLLARMWVDELMRADLAGVCIAPGSRSTPLAIAFAEQSVLPVYVHLDERSAAFFALGLALAQGKPAAVLCTSGTAAANLFPAIIEANLAEVPLIVMTADRPPALRDSGANQTMDQIKLFGNHVRWFVDLPIAEREPADHALRAVRTLAARVVAKSHGPRPGPVHVNIPFDKPLEPSLRPDDFSPEYLEQHTQTIEGRPTGRQFTEIIHGAPTLQDSQLGELARLIQRRRRAVIVCGPRCPSGDFPDAVLALGDALGLPILADALSGVRFHPGVNGAESIVLGAYETFLPDAAQHGIEEPELVLQFGGSPVSTSLLNWLAGLSDTTRILVSAHGAWADEAQCLTHMVVADPTTVCRELQKKIGRSDISADGWLNAWKTMESLARGVVEEAISEDAFEGGWVARITECLEDDAAVFVGSSLPVRHLDEFVGPRSVSWRVFSNRGASGIDGTISTGLGVAAGLERPVIILLGDLALLHDLNALSSIRKFGLNAKTIVINNDGGGIFQRLPVAEFEPPFKDLFKAPHGLTFKAVAEQFGLPYFAIGNASLEFARLGGVLATSGAALIEIEGDAVGHEAVRKRMRANLLQAIEQTSSN